MAECFISGTPLAAGSRAFKSRNFAEAVQILEPSARKGDAAALEALRAVRFDLQNEIVPLMKKQDTSKHGISEAEKEKLVHYQMLDQTVEGILKDVKVEKNNSNSDPMIVR